MRVDSDVVSNLIRKSDKRSGGSHACARVPFCRSCLKPPGKVEKTSFVVQFEAMSPNDLPIVLTQNEYMRRMKEMAAMQPGMSFYGELPDSYTGSFCG